MSRRAALLLAILAPAAGAAAACGEEERGRPAERPAAQAPSGAGRDAVRMLRDAYARTRREGTAQATYRVSGTPGGTLLTAEGPSDLRRTNARLRVRLAGAGGGDLSVHLTGGDAFVELPGAGWRRAPQGATSFSTGLDALAWLGGVTGDVREVGPRRFRVQVDLTRVAGELPAGERRRHREELRRRFRVTRLPAEVGLDRQGHVTRFAVDLPASALREVPAGGVRTLRVEVGLARFGVPVPSAPREAAALGDTDPA